MDVSFQLYSSRSAASQSDVLRMLAQLGYTQVEGFGGVYGDVSAFADAMAGAGVTMPSGHFGVADLENDFDACIATANALGMRHIVAPYLEAQDRPTDAQGYIAFANRLSAILPKVADQGFTFSWHNHDFEFAALPDGSIPMDIILQESPDLKWEADLAWIIRGGADPVDWLGKFGDRMIAVHVKDIAPAGEKQDEDGWADVGHGVVDWGDLVTRSRAVAPDALMVMEHDKPSDVTRFATNSIAAFKAF